LRRLALATAALAAVLAVGAAPASAVPRSEVIEGEHVRLVSTIDRAAAAAMPPGSAVRWDVEVSADAPHPGRLDIAVAATGGLRLQVDALACAVPWRGERCPVGAERLLSRWAPLDEPGATRPIHAGDAARPVFLRLEVRALAGAQPGEATELRIVVDGFGEEVSAGTGGTPGALAATGGAASWSAALAAAVVLAAAGTAALARRRGGEDA
jgi:hypothetical protein